MGNPDPDPTGIGRSYDVTLTAYADTPSRDTFANLASANVRSFTVAVHARARTHMYIQVNIPQLVASPEFYAAHKLFGGRWWV